MILYRGYKTESTKAKNPKRYFGAVAGYSKLRLLLQNCIPVTAQYIRMQGLEKFGVTPIYLQGCDME